MINKIFTLEVVPYHILSYDTESDCLEMDFDGCVDSYALEDIATLIENLEKFYKIVLDNKDKNDV